MDGCNRTQNLQNPNGKQLEKTCSTMQVPSSNIVAAILSAAAAVSFSSSGLFQDLNYVDMNKTQEHQQNVAQTLKVGRVQQVKGNTTQQMAGTCYPNDAQFKGNCDAYFFKAAPHSSFQHERQLGI